MIMNQISQPIHYTAADSRISQCMECEKRYCQTSDEESYTIDSIRNRNCFQAAENCVDRTDNTDCDAQQNHRLEFCDSEHSGDPKNILKHKRP